MSQVDLSSSSSAQNTIAEYDATAYQEQSIKIPSGNSLRDPYMEIDPGFLMKGPHFPRTPNCPTNPDWSYRHHSSDLNYDNMFDRLTNMIKELYSRLADLTTGKGKGTDGVDGCGGEEDTESVTSEMTTKPNENFLWKPVSDKDGKLAIALPAHLTKKVKSVTLIDPKTNKKLGTGKASETAKNGRTSYRFDKAGSKFPDGTKVLIKLKDGSEIKVVIKESSKNYTSRSF